MPIHHLMIGTWTPPGAIFTVAFDDERLTLELIKKTEIPHDEPISWMTFDHARKNIYGAAMKKWSSFSVKSPTEIVHEASHPMLHDPQASSATTNTRAIFLLAAQKPPYAVYANPFYDHAGAGTVLPVSPTGALLPDPVQHFPLDPHSGIHGAAFDPAETHLYSADLRANKIWTHRKDAATGALTLLGSLDAPDPGDHPRWVAMHPSGRRLYALMEAGNRVCEYLVDPATALPVYTDRSWPLVPPGVPRSRLMDGKLSAPGPGPGSGQGSDGPAPVKSMYRSDVVEVSSSGRYLFASSRSNSFDITGYVAAFRLDPATGAVQRQLCLIPTPTSGGHSNAVAPCPWTDEWLAITDDQEGWVEVWRWTDEFLGRVARVRIAERGFGMNAIWYD